MHIGFVIKWPKNAIRQVIGEELYAESLCRELRQMPGVRSAQLYYPNLMPAAKIDIMIHLNESLPGPFARKHVLYLQNFFQQGSDVVLGYLQKKGYDGFAFFSQRLYDLHRQAGYGGIFLPLAADTTIFKPREKNPRYDYDVVYVGNDIKGEERTMRYIYPAAAKYNFGLFGNWWPYPPNGYRDLFAKLSQGSISREESAVLYSSAKIALNYTAEDSIYWDAMNLRFFEVLACKGFLISDKVPSAQRELKGCAVFTDGGEDLIAQIEYYLSRPKEKDEIAANGYQYILQHATVQARAKQLHNYLQQIMEIN
ncbi:MAG TPA: glycosyltransferase [Methylomusa anaerophila]|uniref:Spore protein YkvP/CgeB glycosyl transferase-like domain-containing protein n=1 Tax=Methylomusa anaerophila TaxID=1930071 RepID=A0A348AG79_9FIRM|nr:glycosyltransferase [Methylomusa anaerophila]BBB90077.1 hypothetical protein MAMMFC1_00725 [Methylomusa anaerophila]HML88198.1 glycosyltransferase [Methylomusa anaerophila]